MSVNKLSKFKQKQCQWNKANKLKLKTNPIILCAVAVKTQLDSSAARLEMNLKWHSNLATAATPMFVYIVTSAFAWMAHYVAKVMKLSRSLTRHQSNNHNKQTTLYLFIKLQPAKTGIARIDFFKYKGFSFLSFFLSSFLSFLFIYLVYLVYLCIYLIIYLFISFIYLLFILFI